MKHLIIKSTATKKLHISNSSIELAQVFVRLNITLPPQANLTIFSPLTFENEAKFEESVKNTLPTDLEFLPTQGVNGLVAQLSVEQQDNRENGTYGVAKEYFEGLGYEVELK